MTGKSGPEITFASRDNFYKINDKKKTDSLRVSFCSLWIAVLLVVAGWLCCILWRIWLAELDEQKRQTCIRIEDNLPTPLQILRVLLP